MSPLLSGRLFGISFICTFIAYGTGSGLVEHALSQGLLLINEDPSLLIVGVILMAFVHSVFNLMLAVTVLPLLKRGNDILAYAYFAAAIMATTTLLIGALSYLALMPLSNAYLNADLVADPNQLALIEALEKMVTQTAFYAYHLGMAVWSMGGILLAWGLWRWRLVPKALSLWGLMGYFIFLIASLGELFGLSAGLYPAMVGGLFEISLSIWLIINGFNTYALKSESEG